MKKKFELNLGKLRVTTLAYKMVFSQRFFVRLDKSAITGNPDYIWLRLFVFQIANWHTRIYVTFRK